MKDYLAPDIEKIEYITDDCLTGSKEILTETYPITEILNDLG